MSGRWAAPGRVNLIGEHVDYAGGLCLPFAIAERTVVVASARSDDRLRLSSRAESAEWDGRLADVGPGVPDGWAGYVAGVLWALRSAGHPVRGIDLTVTDSVPLGAGLSSSAALECATALAVDDLFGLGLPRTELAAAGRRAENEIVGAATGGMDQAASLLATAGHALLIDTRDGATRQVPLDLHAAGLTLLVMDTRVRHRLADGQYGARRASVERAAAKLGVASLRDATASDVESLDGELRARAQHVVTEIARVVSAVELLDAGRIAELGPLLDASHASLAQDFEVSCPELDLACEVARASGAFGARMTGGGFGGSAIALVPCGRVDDVTRSVRDAFAAGGHRVPEIRTAEPSAGAARLDDQS